jgi:hypothetical protein
VFKGLTSGVATVGLALAMVMSAVGTAAATPGVSEDVISSPQAMVLHGTHGYGITVDAYPSSRRRGARVVVSVVGARSFLSYTAPASLAGEGIHANLGRFGRIAMRWEPDGRLGEVDIACDGHEPRRRFLVDRGAYVGTLRFRGGSGFTAVRAHRVEWRPSWYRDYSTCPRQGDGYVPGPGKILESELGIRDPGVRFFAYQPKRGEPVEYAAYDREAVRPVKIERTILVHGGPRSLTSSPDFASATLEPPAPFAGTATYERSKGANGTLSGDLSVTFPDGTVASLAGSPFTASFYRGGFERRAR